MPAVGRSGRGGYGSGPAAGHRGSPPAGGQPSFGSQHDSTGLTTSQAWSTSVKWEIVLRPKGEVELRQFRVVGATPTSFRLNSGLRARSIS